MNKKVLIISIFSILLSSNAASEFCDGYDVVIKLDINKLLGVVMILTLHIAHTNPIKNIVILIQIKHGYIIGYEDGRKKG